MRSQPEKGCSQCLYHDSCDCEKVCDWFVSIEESLEQEDTERAEEFYKYWPIYIAEDDFSPLCDVLILPL